MSDSNTREIAERLKGLREMMEISTAEMAEAAGVDEKTYLEYEEGGKDFSVTFLYNCAGRFGVDVTALLTGHTPTLSSYSIVRPAPRGHCCRRTALSARGRASSRNAGIRSAISTWRRISAAEPRSRSTSPRLTSKGRRTNPSLSRPTRGRRWTTFSPGS